MFLLGYLLLFADLDTDLSGVFYLMVISVSLPPIVLNGVLGKYGVSSSFAEYWEIDLLPEMLELLFSI